MPRSPYKKCADPFLNSLCDWSHPVPWLRSMLRSYLIDGLPGCQLKDFNILRVRPWTRPGASAVRGLRSWRPRMGHAAPRRCMQQTVVDERTAAHVSPSNTRCFTRLPHSLTGETGTGIHRFRACTGSDPPKPSLARPMRHQTVCPLSCQPT